MAFARVRAALAGVVVEHFVEILAPYLVGVRRTLADRAGEGVGVVAAFIIGFEIRTRLEHAHGAHLVQHAQPFEHGKIHRQQRFADVKAGVMRLLERDHLVTSPRQQCGGCTAGRAAADHRHVA